MRILRSMALILILVILVAAIAGAIAYVSLNRRNFALPEAKAALISDDLVTVSEPDDQDWFVFTPTQVTPDAGFIIYPGGFVEPAAYAPIARDIAEQGYQVIIDPMPLNLAVLGIEGADSIIASFPEISSWAIGGHSLGGAMASEFTARNPESIDGLALWAAYPGSSTNLSGLPLEAVSIYGDADGVASIADVRDGAARLPESTNFVLIPGGNHTQFGWYGEGLQRGDNPAAISREEQQQLIVDGTLSMLSKID